MELAVAHRNIPGQVLDAECLVSHGSFDRCHNLSQEYFIHGSNCHLGWLQDCGSRKALAQVFASLDKILNAGMKLPPIEWLDDVIVCTGLKSGHLCALGGHGCQQDNRNVACSLIVLEVPAKLDAVHDRHADVADHDIGDDVAGDRESDFAIGCLKDPE